MDSLGRGLESLIPDKQPDEVPQISAATEEIGPVLAEEKPDFSAPALSSSQIPDKDLTPRKSDSVFWIEVDKIEPNPFQPRREFTTEALQDLANSIREHGVLQPVLVIKREIETPQGLEVGYQMIAGERRWRAAKLAGLTQIPAIIRRGVSDDRLKLELALIENVQREDLNPIERARAFKQLIDEFHLVQREIAARVGKSREMVANTLRLLSLPSEIQLALAEGRITEGHARAVLIAGDDPLKRFEVYNAILTDRLNVREAESRARQVSGKIFVPRKRPSLVHDPELREWQQRLQEKLGTKVQFQKLGERGKIVVEFYSDEELRGILDKLIREV